MSMITRTVNYTNFNDQPVSKTLHFYISKAEMAKFAIGDAQGFKERIEAAMAAQDPQGVWVEVEALLKRSYGVKTPDGEDFDKRPEVYAAWEGTRSYDEYVWKLMSDQSELEYFISNIFPMEALDEVRANQAEYNARNQSAVPPEARQRLTDHQSKQPGRRAEVVETIDHTVQPVQAQPVEQGQPIQIVESEQPNNAARSASDEAAFRQWQAQQNGLQ